MCIFIYTYGTPLETTAKLQTFKPVSKPVNTNKGNSKVGTGGYHVYL